MLRMITLIAALALAAGLNAARAQQAAPADRWMEIGALAEKLQAEGYRLIEVERDDGVYEVVMADSQGYRIEAHLDPVTGERLAQRRFDD
ncbi:PepSY domain-containing protein [Poseidonocella sp. HB161398]|uniref:PepSY domain-containing protein n=1 Tax=Poseidonocella sp. HB161398 TaxID=2320855 RepID=UPI00110951B6|nr:PepSY domain-containing protein [Poseidonocella sp. HB161398]